MKSSAALLCLLCLACSPAATPGQEAIYASSDLGLYDLDGPSVSFEMPGRLEEISGLAITSDGRLFGHDDERATVHEIDRATGEVGKRFSIGDPPIEGDFEGIAIVGERFFLVTSVGLLYEFREVGDRETAPHLVTDTGLGASCEVEGLDHDPVEAALLVACKASSPDRGTVVVHRLPLDGQRSRLPPLEIPRDQLAAFGVDADFSPSSIAVTPAGTFLLASADPEALIEVDRTGRALAGHRLPRARHPQSEGLAFGPDGALYVADEQNGAEARVTRYSRADPAGDPR